MVEIARARVARVPGRASVEVVTGIANPVQGDNVMVFSLDGKPPISLGGTAVVNWAAGGALLSIEGESQAFFFPLAVPQILPKIPAGGFGSGAEIARLPGARRIDGRLIALGPTPDVYAYYKGNTQRNLYRIPVP